MNPITLRKIATQIVMLITVLLGILAWSQRPEGWFIWLAGMITMPLAWAIVAGFGATRSSRTDADRLKIYNALLGASAVIAGAMLVATGAAVETLPTDWSTRYGMISSALILIVIGNGLPKKVEPGCSRDRSLAVQRLLGWSFVVGGLAQILLWLLLPTIEELATVLTFSIYGAMFVAIAVGLVRIRREGRTA